jgi:hypothetical protein
MVLLATPPPPPPVSKDFSMNCRKNLSSQSERELKLGNTVGGGEQIEILYEQHTVQYCLPYIRQYSRRRGKDKFMYSILEGNI